MTKKLTSWFLLPLSVSLLLGACGAVEVREQTAAKVEEGETDRPDVAVPAVGAEVIQLGGAEELPRIIPKLAANRVVYVGETHDRYSHHLGQLGIIEGLHQRNPSLAIGMEFFQQPFQPALDDYISGVVDEQEMLRRTQWYERWIYDYRLYRPILQYARQNGIPLIALNVPKEIIQRVSKVGIEGLNEEERSKIPAEIDSSNQAYRERLQGVFKRHAHTKGRDFNRFLQVQLAWDEGMAERVANYLKENPQRQMVVLAGSGHLVNGTGIPQRVDRRLAIDSAIVLPGEDLRIKPGIADYLIFPQAAGLPKPGLMGVFLATDDQGVRISGLSAGGAAGQAGVEKDDLIQALNGEEIKNMSDLRIGLLDRSPGDRIRLTVQREQLVWGEKTLDFEFELGD